MEWIWQMAIAALVGIAVGYLIVGRKVAALTQQLQNNEKEIAGLHTDNQRQLEQQKQATRERENLLNQETDKRIGEYKERLEEQKEASDKRLLEERGQWEARLKQQQEDADALHKRMNAEFENLANRIFKSKTEDFTKLNSEHLNNLLAPLGENLKEFRKQVADVYVTESKERHTLGERIKDLVDLNNRISEDANNLTRALKGDSKMQGNWGEMILERLLQASGLIEGEHYIRQDFLKDEQGNALTDNEFGKRMQPDVIIKYPDEREMIIDSKVSLTAYAAYTAAESKEEEARWLKAHMQSVRAHIDELSKKDYSHYDTKAPDFVMMFIPTESAYLTAIKEDSNLWEYAYNKKIVLMSPTNLISALRLSLDLWKRENQVKNVQEIIKRGTLLYEKIAGFTDTFLRIGDKFKDAQDAYGKAYDQLSAGAGSVIKQAEQLSNMSLTPKKRISTRVLTQEDEEVTTE